MPLRSRAFLAMIAVALLALPAAAVWMRVTTYFFADFDQKAGQGQQSPPLAAEQGSISTTGPASFVVTPQATGGGALLVTSAGQTGADSTLTATFDKPFSGSELQIAFVVTPNVQAGSMGLYAVEDTDGEVIDASWGGNGLIVINGSVVSGYDAGSTYICNLTLRDSMSGPDFWVLTMTKAGFAPQTFTGPLSLTQPLAVNALKIFVPASSVGSMVFDDLQALSAGFGTNK